MSTALLLVVLILLGLFIIIINIATLLILCKCKSLLKPANYPIISFLITGILQGTVVVPAYCVKRMNLSSAPKWICDLFRFPYFLCGHMLTLSVMLVAIDRLIAIKFPFKYDNIASSRNVILVLISTWIAFIVIDILPFIKGSQLESSKCYYVPWAEWSIAVIVLTILIPLITIFCIYGWIWWLAVKHAEKIAESSHSSGDPSQKTLRQRLHFKMELKATKTSALLVGVFLICWAPIGIYYFVENVCNSCIENAVSQAKRDDFGFAVKVISFASCIFSPLIYCWRTREFRRELRQSLRKRGWKVAGISVNFINRSAMAADVTFHTEDKREDCASI